LKELEYCLILDIDNDTVKLPTGGLPKLPNFENLKKTLSIHHSVIFNKERNNTLRIPYKTTEEERINVNCILEQMNLYHSKIMEQIISEIVKLPLEIRFDFDSTEHMGMLLQSMIR
jgi:hypothetical protein